MKSTGSISAAISGGASIIIAAGFLLGTLAAEYTLVERLGGTAWVLILSMIILMPVVTPIMKKRRGA